jgi:flavodoxin
MLMQVVFETMFGNTERVARAVAEGLSKYGEVVVVEVDPSHLGEIAAGVDLLVVGGPTHAFAMSRESTRKDAVRQGATQGDVRAGQREWLEATDPDLAGLRCAVFDTRVSRVRRLPGSAAHSAARALRRRHARLVVPPMSFFVDDVTGPLTPTELTRVRMWGQRVGAAARAADSAASRHAD